eukprot:gene4652-14847_t
MLGWPRRLPPVADCDRSRVLCSWAAQCMNRSPYQRSIPFQVTPTLHFFAMNTGLLASGSTPSQGYRTLSPCQHSTPFQDIRTHDVNLLTDIRQMSPEEFVRILALDLKASGVVAGRNYRFGFKAKGDAKMLQELGASYGLDIHIVDLVADSAVSGSAGTTGHQAEECKFVNPESEEEQVSSSKIRHNLSIGDVRTVQKQLGRAYRLVSYLPTAPHHHLVLPTSSFLNQPPAAGKYKAAFKVVPLQPPAQVSQDVKINGIELVQASSPNMSSPPCVEITESDLTVCSSAATEVVELVEEGMILPSSVDFTRLLSQHQQCYVVVDFLEQLA